MNVLIVIAASVIVNRARGDSSWMPSWLPGRALWYAAPLMGLIAAILHPWPIALAFATAYLFWGTFAWGRWFDLGRLPEGFARANVKPDPLERVIGALARGSDHVALFVRHLLILPGLVLLGWMTGNWMLIAIAVPFAALVVGAYEPAWRFKPGAAILYAELLTGGAWGLLFVGVWYVV